MGIDFIDISKRFDALSNGAKAELRRCRKPDDVSMIPAFYHMFFGESDVRHRRVAYFLPYVGHKQGASSLGVQLANKVNEKRLFQVLRSESPNDLIQLRRLVQQVEPVLDWNDFGKQLYFWNDKSKRKILEDFFSHQNKKS